MALEIHVLISLTVHVHSTTRLLDPGGAVMTTTFLKGDHSLEVKSLQNLKKVQETTQLIGGGGC